MDEKLKIVCNSLATLCARREYCVSDIRSKALSRLDSDAAAAAEVVDYLVRERFVSDLRYATAFARDKASLSAWGPLKIRQALRAKGIGEDDIRAALEETDADRSSEALHRILHTKWKSLKDDPQGKLKLIRFALSRGYSYDVVRPAIETVTGKARCCP